MDTASTGPGRTMGAAPVRILLVEDNRGEARLVRIALEEVAHFAWTLETAASAAEAERALQRAPYDVVLLDLFLPDVQGLAALDRLAPAAAGVPIVVLTGYTAPDAAVAALHHGAADFLDKDAVDGAALARSIRYTLERARRGRHERFLVQVLDAIAGTRNGELALRTIAELAVPGLADWCVVERVDGTGRRYPIGVVSADPARVDALRSAVEGSGVPEGFPTDAAVGEGAARLVRRPDPGVPARTRPDPAERRLLDRLGARELVVAPVRRDGRCYALLTLGSADAGRGLGAPELALVEDVARAAAAIFEHAERLGHAETARHAAERSTGRAQRLARLTAALSSALTPRQVAAVAVDEALRIAGARAGALLLHVRGAHVLEPLCIVGVEPPTDERWTTLGPDGDSPITEALRGEPVRVPDAAALARRYPGFAAGLPASLTGGLAALPLATHERVIGVLLLLEPDGPALDDDTLAVLQACAAECGSALERAALFESERLACERASSAARLRDEVLGIVAHDLRNPMQAIGLYASLLADAEVAPEQRVDWARAIEGLTAQVDRLIQDLLDVSKIESGTLALAPALASPAAVLDDALRMMGPAAAAAGVRLTATVAEDTPALVMDAGRMLQVLSNLLQNAIRFTPRDGRVALSARACDDEVVFSVSDEGPGIAADDLPHLFDRFWQAKQTRRGGAGLGLAIARGIVDRHRGRIEVQSTPGAGTTFHVALPLRGAGPDSGAPAAPPQDRGTAGPGGDPAACTALRPARVLLVDDHPFLRRGLRTMLDRTGLYEVVGEAATGEQAVQLVPRTRPELVVMDLHLPGMHGLEATRQIVAAHPEVRVLALSAEAEADTLLEVLEAGGSGFVAKSSAEAELLPALEAARRGEVYLQPAGSAVLLRALRRERGGRGRDGRRMLSDNERRVIALAAEGYTSAEIGKRLYLSPATVDSYRSRAMRKLGLGGRRDLVRFALDAGLLAEPAAPAGSAGRQ